MEYTRAQVTFPLLTTAPGVPVIIRAAAKMFVGKNVEAKPGQKQMEPPTILPVIDLEAIEAGRLKEGTISHMIVGAVLKKELEQAFPNDKYIGEVFEITKQAKKDGKTYSTFAITHLKPKK